MLPFHTKTIRTLCGAAVLLTLLVLSVAYVQAVPQRTIAPTYVVFATREGLVGHVTANGHIIRPRDHFVALPSWTVVSPAGTHQYQVRVSYRGRSTVAPVWDVGPWNINDDYWMPNRAYSDLRTGMPRAQAAFLYGYRGGIDEFNRRTGNPAGIDLADGTFWDALGMRTNDWVHVTFLWMGDDPSHAEPVQAPPLPADFVPHPGVSDPGPIPAMPGSEPPATHADEDQPVLSLTPQPTSAPLPAATTSISSVKEVAPVSGPIVRLYSPEKSPYKP